MPIKSVRCPVLGAHITHVTNLEGETMKMICAHYEEPTGICRVKSRAAHGGLLSQFLERVSEDALDTKNTRCILRVA